MNPALFIICFYIPYGIHVQISRARCEGCRRANVPGLRVWIRLQMAVVRLWENEGVKVRNREMESGPGSLAVCSKSQFGHGHSGTADYPHTELQAGHHCSKMTLLISQAAHQPSRGANGIPLLVCFHHAWFSLSSSPPPPPPPLPSFFYIPNLRINRPWTLVPASLASL